MDYTICYGTASQVAHEVKLLLSDKWELHGNLTPYASNMVCQAMVLKKKSPSYLEKKKQGK